MMMPLVSLRSLPRPAPNPLEATIRASRLFTGVSPRSLALIAGAAHRRSFGRGERVWEPGTPANHFTFIVSGLVKIVRRSADQGEFIVALFGPRESVGDAAVVGRGNYPAACECASERLSVVRVDAPVVLGLMSTDESVGAAVRGGLLDHNRALLEKIDVMSAGAVPQRLARLFIGLAERFGDEREEGGTFVPLSLSRSELAYLVGARVETTIRTLSRWQKDGIITSSKDGLVILDPARLSAAAGGA